MNTVCAKSKCAGCMLCADICPEKAIIIHETVDVYDAVIDETKCSGCGICRKFCMQNNKPELLKPTEWHQGWSISEAVRAQGSSGGVAQEISRSFIDSGGIVLACVFREGKFVFSFFDNNDNLSRISGSKYVKSNPSGIYKPLLERLNSGKQVLMIGLPCQISAAKAYTKNHKNLYTIDLICHGTPSPELLNKYLKEKRVDINGLCDLQFRRKASFGLRDRYKLIDKLGTDAYTYAFMISLSYTENCYDCKYARPERVADLTIGDSWGSELSLEERAKGISLILSMTEKGKELLGISEIELIDVDLQKAIEANSQLKMPSIMPESREKFFEKIKQGKKLDWVMLKPRSIFMFKNGLRRIKALIKRCLPGYSKVKYLDVGGYGINYKLR